MAAATLSLDSSQTTPFWTASIETEIFEQCASNLAPRTRPAWPASSPDEIRHILDHWTWVAGHDSHIVQCLSRTAPLFDTLEEQLMIARQMGDDGAHAEFPRSYIAERSGHDPIAEIIDIADQHADMLGDLPWRNRLSWFAWELHYELYILARLMMERRTARLFDPGLQVFAQSRIGPDEEEHRIRVMNWFLAYYYGLDLDNRHNVAQAVVTYDDEIQGRLRSYLTFRYRQSAVSTDLAITDAAGIYDRFRRGVLTRVLGDVGDLVSLGFIEGTAP